MTNKCTRCGKKMAWIDADACHLPVVRRNKDGSLGRVSRFVLCRDCVRVVHEGTGSALKRWGSA